MLAIAFVLGALDFGVASLLAKLLQRLAAHAQMIFHLCQAGAPGVPLLLELLLARVQTRFFSAQSFEVESQFFGLYGQRRRFFFVGDFLLATLPSAAVTSPALPGEPSRNRLAGRKTLLSGRHFRATSRQ